VSARKRRLPPAEPGPESWTPPSGMARIYQDAPTFRAWLLQLEARITDLAAVAEDQIAPPAKRQLGRAKARDLIGDACHAIDDLIGIARADLPPEGSEPGTPPLH